MMRFQLFDHVSAREQRGWRGCQKGKAVSNHSFDKVRSNFVEKIKIYSGALCNDQND